MKKRLFLVAGLIAAVPLLTAGSCENKNIVDGKSVVEVPAVGTTPASVCYLLEIERQDANGAEQGESYVCVSRAEYDKNNVEEEWVDSSGKPVR